MIILSIDVGMKYLAYCLFSVDSDHSFSIKDWNIINLCNTENKYCQGIKKNHKLCKRASKFHKHGKYYCKIHAKNKQSLIPTNEMKYIKLKNKKVKFLRQFCKERNYNIKKKPKKKDYLDAIVLDLSNNYFNFVKNVDSRKVNLITYGQQIKKQFTEKFKNIDIDCILVENQVGPLALRMKVLQGMIIQHFIEHNYPLIKEISPTNKLKEFIHNKKTTYHERKKLSVQITKTILSEKPTLESWQPYFTAHKKKDDLADAFLQGRWYIKEKIQ